jgi:hypothetical protein
MGFRLGWAEACFHASSQLNPALCLQSSVLPGSHAKSPLPDTQRVPYQNGCSTWLAHGLEFDARDNDSIKQAIASWQQDWACRVLGRSGLERFES